MSLAFVQQKSLFFLDQIIFFCIKNLSFNFNSFGLYFKNSLAIFDKESANNIWECNHHLPCHSRKLLSGKSSKKLLLVFLTLSLLQTYSQVFNSHTNSIEILLTLLFRKLFNQRFFRLKIPNLSSYKDQKVFPKLINNLQSIQNVK